MRDVDVTPIVDADTVRRAIATAQDEVCGALRCVATRLGRGATGLTVRERREARALDGLGLQASELHAVQAASATRSYSSAPETSRHAPMTSCAASASCRPSPRAHPPTT